MAEKTKEETKDFIEQIGGTLTLEKAETVFGKAHAIAAMQTFAREGGHGHFEELELRSPLFGGLQAPRDKGSDAYGKINAALNGLK